MDNIKESTLVHIQIFIAIADLFCTLLLGFENRSNIVANLLSQRTEFLKVRLKNALMRPVRVTQKMSYFLWIRNCEDIFEVALHNIAC